MITRVALKNWKSHLDSEFEFSSGVNALMGIMGSGKSSVMQAISFALFGTFPSHQTRKISLDDLIMTRPQKKKQAEIELDFRLDGDEYRIKRVLELGKGTTQAEIRKNGQMLEVNPQGVNREVERILQIDYELFSKAVYSEQDGIDYFLRIPKGQRMAQIDRMIKLDRFGKVRERSVSLRNKIAERRKEKMRFVVEMEKEDLEDKITDIEEELRAISREQFSLKERLEKLSKEKNRLSQSVVRFEDMESDLNDLRVSIGSVNAGIKEVMEQIKEKASRIKGRSVSKIKEDFEELERKIRELEKSIGEQREDEKRLRERISELNTRIRMLNKEDIPRLEDEIERLEKEWGRFNQLAKKFGSEPEKELEEKSRELESFRKHLYNLEARKREVLDTLGQLKEADTRCPVCDSPLDEHKKEELISHRVRVAESLDRELASSREKARKLESTVAEMEEAAREIAVLKERLKNYDDRKRELEDSRKEVGELRKVVNRAASLIEGLKAGLEKSEKELRDRQAEKEKIQGVINDMENMAGLQRRLNEYQERKKALEEQARKLEDQLKSVDIKGLRSGLQAAIARESEANAKLVSLEEKTEEKKKALEDLKKRRDLMQKYQKEVLRDEMVAMQLETFVKVLRITQEQLREEFLKSVNAIMNRIWDELYPYGDFSEIKLAVEEGDYVLKLRASDGWVPVEGVASGGERSMSVLALRMAFSLAFIPNLRWLILDEPTHNLDSNSINHFAEVLRDKMDKFAEQVFLITHEEGIANGITGQIYRLERNKSMNEATRIIQKDDFS